MTDDLQVAASKGMWRALPRELRLFLALNILLIAACAAAEIFCKFVLHLHGSHVFPLLREHWPDFYNFKPRFDHLQQLEFFTDTDCVPFMYPAPMALLYWLFYHLGPSPIVFFLFFILASVAVGGALFCRALIARGVLAKSAILFVAVAYAASYPLWFVFKQANMEIVIWVMIATALWCILHCRNYTAAVLVGIAASIKIFPFVYLGIFLARRRYREVVVSLLAAVITMLIGLRFIYSDIHRTWMEINKNLAVFRTDLALQMSVPTGWDHSLWAVAKKFMHHPVEPTPHTSHLLTAYMALTAVLGLTIYFVRIRRLPFENQVICLGIASIMLPPVSFDYTLIHLYAPLALLSFVAVAAWKRGVRVAGLTAAFVCLAILSSPTTEFIHRNGTYGGQVKGLVLLVLFCIALRYPFSEETLTQALV